MDNTARAKIYALQPFAAPQDNLSLWSLNCLNIIDKHRYIRIMNAYAFGPPALSLPKESGREHDPYHILSNWDSSPPRGFEYLQNRMSLFRYNHSEPAFGKDNFSFQVVVLFDDAILAQEEPSISLERKQLLKTYDDIANKGPRGSVRLVLENLYDRVSTLVEDVSQTTPA